MKNRTSLLDYIMADMWMIEPDIYANMIEIIERHTRGDRLAIEDIQAITASRQTPAESGYRVQDGTAIIPIHGVISKYSSQVNNISQPQGISCEAIQGMLAQAADDEDVESVMLDIESPGGCVFGIPETSDAIHKLRQTKPVHAFANDRMCSAAYFLGSQADQIFATESAFVGSIGVITGFRDTTAQMEREGVKMHYVATGVHKTTGYPGVEMSDERLAAVQANIDGILDVFKSHVQRGRGTSDESWKSISDGRTWVGVEAKAAGLIDGIKSADCVLAGLKDINGSADRSVAASARSNLEKDTNMADEKTFSDADVQAAATDAVKNDRDRFAALRSQFPDNPTFAADQFDKGHSVEQAKADFADVMVAEYKGLQVINACLQADMVKLQADVDAAAKAADDSDATDHNPAGDTSGDFMAQANALAEEKDIPLHKAVRKLANSNPDLHRAWLESQPRGRASNS